MWKSCDSKTGFLNLKPMTLTATQDAEGIQERSLGVCQALTVNTICAYCYVAHFSKYGLDKLFYGKIYYCKSLYILHYNLLPALLIFLSFFKGSSKLY